MKKNLLALLFVILSFFPLYAGAFEKGIYITQWTLETTPKIKYLIQRAKASGINTFVIDLEKMTKTYPRNIKLVEDSGIRYVARIIVFSDGGNHAQVTSREHWDKKLALAKQAVALGAKEIQLDYIRYNTKQPPSTENAKNVIKVIQYFRKNLAAMHIPLQVDIFGVTAFNEEFRIGQNAKMIGENVDALCPMVYPSHFEPFRAHAVTPYETVYDALMALKEQFNDKISFKLYPYIELSNYRYPLSHDQRIAYIRAQLKAVDDAKADGWYVWSPNNLYDILFDVLQTRIHKS